MKEIQKLIRQKELTGIAEYLSIFRKVQKELVKKDFEKEPRIKIALLFSSTIKGFKETLTVKCLLNGILPEIYQCDYGQHSQEILNLDSELYKFNADLIIVGIDLISFLGERYFLPYASTTEQRRKDYDSDLSHLKDLINTIKERSSAKIIFHDFMVPEHSPLGIMENKQEFGFIESIQTFNASLKSFYKLDSQVFIFEFDAFAASVGKSRFIDAKMYYLGDIKMDMNHIPPLCEQYIGYIKPMCALSRKCIVLDLDNTLWGGIVGEDGVEGIQLGPTNEGRPYWEFQKYLLSLFNRGVILAVNSKNNENDALKAIREHPYMVLREEHFASMKINWVDKISNMKAIAEEINIGLNSLVFFDDDQQNRSMINSALPDVLVVDLPVDASLYPEILASMNDFNSLQLTAEDLQKGKIYAQQRGRNQVKKAATNIVEYLENLEMKVTIYEANSLNIPRISQLTMKTNQFNLTTKRFKEEEIKSLVDSPDFIVFCFKVEDRFGDNGIAGVVILKKLQDCLSIEAFLLSCRIIGRNVEKTMLKHIIDLAGENGFSKVCGKFIPTSKNAPAKDFFSQNGFKKIGEDNDVEVWEFDTRKSFSFPEYIKVIKG